MEIMNYLFARRLNLSFKVISRLPFSVYFESFGSVTALVFPFPAIATVLRVATIIATIKVVTVVNAWFAAAASSSPPTPIATVAVSASTPFPWPATVP